MVMTLVVLPVPPGSEEQMTNSFCVPPLGIAPMDLIRAIDASRPPLNGAAVPFTTGEMLVNVFPSAWSSLNSPDPWYPDGHATLVDQVGLLFIAPLAGFSLSVPALPP